MIRRFLQREGRWLLQELNVADFRTLWRRAVFYAFIWTATAAVLLGLVWLEHVAGIEAMGIAAVAIIVLALWMERHMPVYSSDMWWLGEQLPALPPPGQPSSAGAGHAAARSVEYGAHHQASTRVAEKQSQVKRQELAERILKG